MRLVLDGRCLTTKATGIANYTIAMIRELARNKDLEIIILLHNRLYSEGGSAWHDDLGENTTFHEHRLPFLNKGLVWYFILLPLLLRKYRPDYFWSTSNILPLFIPRKVKKVLTVHDVVSIRFQGTMPILHRVVNGFVFGRSVRRADLLLVNSNYTKQQIDEIYPKRKCPELIVGNGVDHVFYGSNRTREDEIVAERLGLQDLTPYLLFVGTLEPRKNLKFLLSVMADVREDLSLAIVGMRGWGNLGLDSELGSDLSLQKRVKFLGYVSREDLRELYRGAYAVVMPSINEGLGLPLVEAMCCGCPVVAASNSGMVEVVHEAGHLVEGWTKSDWVQSIHRVEENRRTLIKLGRARATEYRWGVLAEKFYGRLLETVT